MDMTKGLAWAITRLDMKIEILIKALGNELPGFDERLQMEKAKQLQAGLLRVVAAETWKEIQHANDGIWLKQQGISDDILPPGGKL